VGFHLSDVLDELDQLGLAAGFAGSMADDKYANIFWKHGIEAVLISGVKDVVNVGGLRSLGGVLGEFKPGFVPIATILTTGGFAKL